MAIINCVNQNSTGIQVLTSTPAFVGRTLTGTTNQIAISNGDGTSGNPTIALASTVLNATQPAFLAYNSAQISNITGDATAYTVLWDAEQYDQASNFNTGTGTFTSPATGKYYFACTLSLGGLLLTHTTCTASIVTTSTTFACIDFNPFTDAIGTNIAINFSAIAAMTANDTATILLTISGGTKVVDILFGSSANLLSSFGGFLIC